MSWVIVSNSPLEIATFQFFGHIIMVHKQDSITRVFGLVSKVDWLIVIEDAKK
jgi:hypothetical protein